MTELIDPVLARQFDRLPPHSIEHEMCALASMMLDGDMLDQVSLVIDREDLFQTDHQVIFDVLLKMREQGKAIDALILREELERRQLLEEVGGAKYLGDILDTVPSAAHGMHYANVVRDKSQLRQLIAASNDILRDAYAPHENVRAILDRAERRVLEVADRAVTNEPVLIGDVMQDVYARVADQGDKGIETGFFELDDLMMGLHDGEMIVVGARPSIGKTAFAINILEHLSCELKLPTALFSLEMSKQQIGQRMMCARARVDSHKLRKGMLTGDEYGKLAAVVAECADAPIHVDDTPTLTTMELRAKSRRLKSRHGIRAIVVDYMQLMESSEDGRQQQITELSRGLKATARELKVPVIALSQLNRVVETRDGHRPRMSDLRESGSIEQDADVILLLHREDYYRRVESDFMPDNIAEVIVAKQRNGPTGTAKLTFNDHATRFENLSTHADPF